VRRVVDMLRTCKRAWLPLAAACALCLPPTQAVGADVKADPNGLAPQPVRDLAYGDVLFYFFQDDYFAAITRLLAARQQQQLKNTGADAELLLGGLYLSLGEHVEAGRIFKALLDANVPEAVRNRAWYYLGKVWYERGYLQESERALERVSDKIDPRINAERTMLLAEIMMRESRYDEAIALLRAWHGPPDWAAYANFNLGVALVREGRLADAVPFLDRVGRIDARGQEFLALKDKANLALGFALLQAKRAGQAKRYLQRVRLEGPFSTKALLGFGWAEAMSGHYKRALVPWLALRKRDLVDAAVQESFLAVPYAYSQLHADAQAAEYYKSAIHSFDGELRDIDASIESIRRGKLLDRLLANDKARRISWYWQLEHLPNAPESRYLYVLLASDDFQEGLKNYRELAYMRQNLRQWRGSIAAFNDMLATKRAAYAERVPKADAVLASTDLDALMKKRVDFESRLDEIAQSHDVAALATPAEQKTWARLQRIGAYFEAHPDDPSLAEMREKYRLMKGVMYWRLDQSFRARLWNERRAVKELTADLQQTQRRFLRVRQARRSIPTDTGADAARVAAVAQRMDQLQDRLAQISADQNRFLQTLAIEALDGQRRRIEAYLVQTRYALASIYDRAVNGPRTPAKEAP